MDSLTIRPMAPDGGSLERRYAYGYDLAGNRTQQNLSLNGAAPTVTSGAGSILLR